MADNARFLSTRKWLTKRAIAEAGIVEYVDVEVVCKSLCEGVPDA